jgi:hypothetical protein
MSDIKKFAGDLEVVKGKARELYQSFDYSYLESAVDYINDVLSNIRQWERDVDALGDDIETIIEEVNETEDKPETPKKENILFWSMTSLITEAIYKDDYIEELRELSVRFEPFWMCLCYLMRDGSYESVYKISKFLTMLDTPEESIEDNN